MTFAAYTPDQLQAELHREMSTPYVTGRSLRNAVTFALALGGDVEAADWLHAHREDPDIVATFNQAVKAIEPALHYKRERNRLLDKVRREVPADVLARVRVDTVPSQRPPWKDRDGLTRYPNPVLTIESDDPRAVRMVRRAMTYGLSEQPVVWLDAPMPPAGKTPTQLGEEIAATVEKDWKRGRGASRELYMTGNFEALGRGVMGLTREQLGRVSPYGGWDAWMKVADLPAGFVELMWRNTVPELSDVVVARKAADKKHREALELSKPARDAERAAVRDRRLDVSDLPPLPPMFDVARLPDIKASLLARVRVDRQAAYLAHAGTSFDPERRAEQEIAGARHEVEPVIDQVLKVPRSEGQLDVAVDGLRDYIAAFNSMKAGALGRRSGLVSTMIAGPSNFPVARQRKKSEQYEKFVQESEDKLGRLLQRILRDVERKKIEEAGGELAFARRRLARSVERGDDSQTVRRYEERVEELRRIEDAARKIDVADEDLGALVFRGKTTVTVDLDPSEDRIRVSWSKGADDALMAAVKGSAFRWSPRNTAWQRDFTQNTASALDAALASAGYTLAEGSTSPGPYGPVLNRYLALRR